MRKAFIASLLIALISGALLAATGRGDGNAPRVRDGTEQLGSRGAGNAKESAAQPRAAVKTAAVQSRAGIAAKSRTAAKTAAATASTRARGDSIATRSSATAPAGASKSRAAVKTAVGATTTRLRGDDAAGRGGVGKAAGRNAEEKGGAGRAATGIAKGGVKKARAAATDGVVEPTASTRVGAAYETCKNTYFTCMDQFCAVKNEKYRRCSCSDKIFDMEKEQSTLEAAAGEINDFNSDLDTVSMTAEQASSIREASEGEEAMGKDSSASKRLLSAIMNSISGTGDSKVSGGSIESLNSISFGSTNPFGSENDGQQMASYNGKALYAAIYGQCRNAVRDKCSDEALQRAVTAYLMAVENDCSTVSTMIADNRKKMSLATRESAAMLALARVENRQAHNSADATECLGAVESSIKNEQVCGDGYMKCLDNGEYIDKETGRPFSGIHDFYKLGSLLAFNEGAAAGNQKLGQNPANREFVTNFTSRNKKFAKDALDKCVDMSGDVWRDYLDKAMLEIYYAQQSKVGEIKHGCLDFVAACRGDAKKAVTDFMATLMDDYGSELGPGQITLTTQLCENYVESCTKMFGSSIVSDYVDKVNKKDILTECRNVAKECFASHGGTSYSNFFNPVSGLFKTGNAYDWFTLYEYAPSSERVLKSTCAKQIYEIEECRDNIETIFGGFDKGNYTQTQTQTQEFMYGKKRDDTPIPANLTGDGLATYFERGEIRPTGVATEVYNIIIGLLSSDCSNLYLGKFVPSIAIDYTNFCHNNDDLSTCKYKDANNVTHHRTPCWTAFNRKTSKYLHIRDEYQIGQWTWDSNGKPFFDVDQSMNICVDGWGDKIDVDSWGICSCWENGGRHNDGSGKCATPTWVWYVPHEKPCPITADSNKSFQLTGTSENGEWNECKSEAVMPSEGVNKGKICPFGASVINNTECSCPQGFDKYDNANNRIQ